MSQQAPKRFLITEALAQSILNYLAEKPFKESAMLIQNLQRLEPYAEPSADAKQPKEHKEPPKKEEAPDDDKGD